LCSMLTRSENCIRFPTVGPLSALSAFGCAYRYAQNRQIQSNDHVVLTETCRQSLIPCSVQRRADRSALRNIPRHRVCCHPKKLRAAIAEGPDGRVWSSHSSAVHTIEQ